MNPLWIVIASKPALDKTTGERAAEIEAMYRRPDATPLPAVPATPGRLEVLRGDLSNLIARINRAIDQPRTDHIGRHGDHRTEP